MEASLNRLLRNELRIGYYPDEMSEMNDGHKIYVSTEDLANLEPDELQKLIETLKENK